MVVQNMVSRSTSLRAGVVSGGRFAQGRSGTYERAYQLVAHRTRAINLEPNTPPIQGVPRKSLYLTLDGYPGLCLGSRHAIYQPADRPMSIITRIAHGPSSDDELGTT